MNEYKITIKDSKSGVEILMLMEQLRNMPEYKLYLELMSLNSSIYILDKNYEELKDYIETLTTDPQCAHLFWPENRYMLRGISIEIIRRLHNYVAAVLSLRDHTLTLYNKYYKDSGRFPEYKNEVKEVFGEDKLAQFIMGLRQYCQHYQSPNLIFQTRISDTDGNASHTVMLSIEDLQSFDGWDPLALEFINSGKDPLDILALAKSYKEKVLKFYEWFQVKQQEIHSDEIRRTKELESRILLLQIEEKVDTCIQNEKEMPYRGEEVFSTVFTNKEYNELKEIPSESPRRVERALELLREHLDVPSELAKKILLLYKNPLFIQSRIKSSTEK